MNKIGIIGYGHVGKAYARFFGNHAAFETVILDPILQGESATKEEINECVLAVVCVPTPMRKDGSCDTSIVEETLRWVKTPLVLIKSTVEPGYASSLPSNVCFSPEYIGEGKYFVPFWRYADPTDPTKHGFIVIGGQEPARGAIVDTLLQVMGPSTKVLKMTNTEAAIVKYMENAWGGTKVTFANEFYEICKAFGADYQTVREGFVADERVERMHTMVRSESRGFGGKCFPKDINAIVNAAEEHGYEPRLLKQVLNSNDEFVLK